MTGLTLDAGALIAHEREDRRLGIGLQLAVEDGIPVYVPAGVLAQVWRGGPRKARLAHLLASRYVQIVDLDRHEARAAGRLCGVTRTSDVVDASVVICAVTRRTAIVTSDPDDLRRLDPDVELIIV